jgi:hypothetical protein
MNDFNSPTNRQLFKHKGRGHSPEISQKRNRNKPPSDEAWSWRTLAMVESPAWRALPSGARTVIERIEIEHMKHAGTQNGKLPVTYGDFEAHGADRSAIRLYISIAVTLGFIDVTEEGHCGAGDTRRAARYALTWIDRHDGAPRSNRWRKFETLADAKKAIEQAKDSFRAQGGRPRSRRLRVVAAQRYVP